VKDWKEEAKKALVESGVFQESLYGDKYHRVVRSVADALQRAAKVSEGCVRDDKGVERQIVGSGLILTGDGCVVGRDARLFYQGEDGYGDDVAMCWLDYAHGMWEEAMIWATWYSTKEAALAGSGERGDG
jgi:hypothetical protein